MVQNIVYPYFEENQVLSAQNLNDLVNYLINEDGLTRSYLNGVGIVCGLSPSISEEGDAILVSKGFGITSLGLLIRIDEDLRFTHYNEGVNIEPSQFLRNCNINDEIDDGCSFKPAIVNNESIEVVELVEEGIDNSTLISGSEDFKAFFKDRCLVVLRFESEIEQGPCLDTCDSGGQLLNIANRFFLVDTEFLKCLGLTCEDCEDCDKMRIDVPCLKRFGHNLDGAGKVDLSLLKDMEEGLIQESFFTHYLDLIGVGASGSQLLEGVRSKLLKAFNNYRKKLNLDIESNKAIDLIGNYDGFVDQIEMIGENSILGFGSSYKAFLIQYAYDSIKDIITAIEEFLDCACELDQFVEMPDRCAFPGFLVLGNLPGILNGDCCRTEFVQTCGQSTSPNLVRKSKFLFDRISKLLKAFNNFWGMPNLEMDFNSIKSNLIDKKIKITPGKSAIHPFGERAMPYYIAFTDAELDFEMLQKCWNYDYIKRKKYKDIPSYHLEGDAHTRFLTCTLDPCDFLRIEGHIGYPINDAFNEIKRLRKCYNLPFDIKCVKLADVEELNIGNMGMCGDSNIFDEKDIDYSDLEAPYLAAVENFKCELEEYLESEMLSIEVNDLIGFLSGSIEGDDSGGEDNFEESIRVFLMEYLQIVLMVDKDMSASIDLLQEKVITETANRPSGEELPTGLICAQRVIFEFYKIRESRKRAFKQESYFENFVLKHPGMEHLAGVPKGGTFILVYCDLKDDNGETCMPTVVADFSLPYYCCGQPGGTTIVNTFEPTPIIVTCKKIFCWRSNHEPTNVELNNQVSFYPSNGMNKPIAKLIGQDGNSKILDGAIVEQDGQYYFVPTSIQEDEFGTLPKLTVELSYEFKDVKATTLVEVWKEPQNTFLCEYNIEDGLDILTLTSDEAPYEGFDL